MSGLLGVDLVRVLVRLFAAMAFADLGARDGVTTCVPTARSAVGGRCSSGGVIPGEQCVVRDLQDATERDLLLLIVNGIHVWLDSFPPGVMDRLGPGTDRSPRVIRA